MRSTTKPTWKHQAIGFLAVAVLAFLLFELGGNSPTAMETGRVQSEEIARKVGREEGSSPTPVMREPVDVGESGGRVRLAQVDGSPVSRAGLTWPATWGPLAESPTEVVNGRGILSEALVSQIAAIGDLNGIPRVLVGGGVVEPTSVAWNEVGSNILAVTLPRSHLVEVLVTDLRGIPIPGAHVAVGGPRAVGDVDTAVSNDDGKASVLAHYPGERAFEVLVSADGFAPESTVVNDASRSVHVRLRALVGYAVIQDLRLRRWGASTRKPFPEARFLQEEEFQGIARIITNRAKLRSFERIRFHVWAEAESHITDSAAAISIDGEAQRVTAKLSVHQVLSPEFEVFRPELDPDSTVRAVNVHFDGNDEVLLALPEQVVLTFEDLDQDEARGTWHASQIGSRSGVAAFTFWLPAGEYAIKTARLPGPAGLIGGQCPAVLSGSRVVVNAAESTDVRVSLDPSFACGEFQIIDSAGYVVSAAALVLPGSRWPTARPNIRASTHPFGGASPSGEFVVGGTMRDSGIGTPLGPAFRLQDLPRVDGVYLIEVDFEALGISPTDLL